jgi:hypothetical protein
MQLRKSDEIAGLPAKTLRDFFRRMSGWESVGLSRAAEYLRMSERRTLNVLEKLQELGYVTKESKSDGWALTTLAMRVRNAGFRSYTRTAAERALNDFLDRVNQVNERTSGHLYWIEAVYGFGSFFFTDAYRVGDVDLIMVLRLREDQKEYERRREKLIALTDRRFRNIIDELLYPKNLLLRFIKGRSAIIALHNHSQLKLPGLKKKVVYLALGTSESQLEADLKRDGWMDTLPYNAALVR